MTENKDSMKIVYVTGCLGFMGSYVTRIALERGWFVFGVDKMTHVSNPDLLDEFFKYDRFRFEKCDIQDLKNIYDCDYVINFAAESHVDNSIINSDEFIGTNIIGVKNILELIKNKPTNCDPRPIFFHISTDEVYGDIDHGSHLESDMLKPSNPYSAAKASADMLVNAWARTYNINYIILRPTNNYGIGQYPEKLIPLSIKNLIRGKKIRLHNDGTPIRNWLHAEDTASAVMHIIDSDIVNEVYNVSGGYEQTNNDVVKKLIGIFYNTDVNWKERVDYSAVNHRPGQDLRYSLDDSKIRKLGWLPDKVFDDELPKIVDYYRNNFIW